MTVDRGPFTILLVILAILLIGNSILAEDADDSGEQSDLPSFSACRYHVTKALEQYWHSGSEKSDRPDEIELLKAEQSDDDKDHEKDKGGDESADKEDDDDEKDVDDSDANADGKEDKDQQVPDTSDGEDDNEEESEGKNGDKEEGEDKNDEKENEVVQDEETEGSEDNNDALKEEENVKTEDSSDNEAEEVSKSDVPEQKEITQAEVQELAAADDFVETEDENTEEEQPETMEVPQTGRDHIDKIMDLYEETDEFQKQEKKLVNGILKDLKRLYDQIIKPMENLYKYKKISTRRFADAEIYSQPMVLFVGPWNSGKSTIINYLLDLEGTEMALDTGPASAGSQFIVLSHADKERKVDGTELAADWRFAGIQKFGQGFIDALVGRKLPRLLLDKITIVEAPGIREKQKNLNYPFDDSLQWFIDRADIIYAVFDPTKLEMGREVELLMDQLKGREKYLRFLINKADTVDTENLMKVTSQLFWTLSPMLTTSSVPISYTVSLWSKPYQEHADAAYLSGHEVSMLRDMKKHTIDKLVENKLAHGRRYAVTVRNHAKLVDCYLTHYYKQKSLFASKNKVAGEIINNPEKYKIFESISMLNNVSRYDLPNPDIYKDFFKVSPLYDFKQLKDTCSYFKGCPIDKLNVCIAYDLPQLLGKYKKALKELNESDDRKKDT